MRKINAVYLLLGVLLLNACSNTTENSSAEGIEETPRDPSQNELTMDGVKNLFYFIPSPIETIILLKKAGAHYDPAILNDPNKVNTYESSAAKALNLGIYGTDLSYAALFSQTQETMFFVSSAKKLAEGIGVMKAFDETAMERIENNIGETDSMLHVISDVYWIADSYLKENESSATSALIIVGGWIEGLYIAAEVAKKNPKNPELMKRIAEQKYSLSNLIGMISNYSESSDIQGIIPDLKRLKEVYEKMNTTKKQDKTSVSTNKSGVTTIGGNKKIDISKAQLEELSKIITEIRLKYVEGNI